MIIIDTGFDDIALKKEIVLTNCATSRTRIDVDVVQLSATGPSPWFYPLSGSKKGFFHYHNGSNGFRVRSSLVKPSRENSIPIDSFLVYARDEFDIIGKVQILDIPEFVSASISAAYIDNLTQGKVKNFFKSEFSISNGDVFFRKSNNMDHLVSVPDWHYEYMNCFHTLESLNAELAEKTAPISVDAGPSVCKCGYVNEYISVKGYICSGCKAMERAWG